MTAAEDALDSLSKLASSGSLGHSYATRIASSVEKIREELIGLRSKVADLETVVNLLQALIKPREWQHEDFDRYEDDERDRE